MSSDVGVAHVPVAFGPELHIPAVQVGHGWMPGAFSRSPVTYTDTASGSVTKLATLETGLSIQVPLFIKDGEKVKVHTETREFARRA